MKYLNPLKHFLGKIVKTDIFFYEKIRKPGRKKLHGKGTGRVVHGDHAQYVAGHPLPTQPW
jgi:hypothetical protein